MNLCLNQSTCVLNLKSFLFFRIQHHTIECRTMKLKYIQLNYTCINEKILSFNILDQSKKSYIFSVHTKNIIIICLSLIISISLLALICSFIREENFSINNQHDIEIAHFNNPSIYDNAYKQEYELKILSTIQSSSSSSTLTSQHNRNSITNPSEYDNLTKDMYTSLDLQAPFKVKFNENYQLK